MYCRGLHSAGKPLRYRGFACPVLHCIAFPLVSEWCQTMSGILALALQRFLAPLLVSPPKQAQHSIGRPLRVALRSALQRVAMRMGCMASWADESLFQRPPSED